MFMLLVLVVLFQMSESQIKRQYHNTVRIQQKQYKALQKQMIATVPKERHREVLRQTKEEQMRKIAMLALQYERTIADMAQKQTVSTVKYRLTSFAGVDPTMDV